MAARSLSITGDADKLWAKRFLGHPTTFRQPAHWAGQGRPGRRKSFLWRVYLDRCKPLKGLRLPCRANRPGVGKDKAGEYSSGDGGEWIAELWTSPLGDDPGKPVLKTKLGQTHVNGKEAAQDRAGRSSPKAGTSCGRSRSRSPSRSRVLSRSTCAAPAAPQEYFAANFTNGPFAHDFNWPQRDGAYWGNVTGAWQRAGDSGEWKLDLASDVQPFAPKILFEYADGMLIGITDTAGGAPELMVGGP